MTFPSRNSRSSSSTSPTSSSISCGAVLISMPPSVRPIPASYNGSGRRNLNARQLLITTITILLLANCGGNQATHQDTSAGAYPASVQAGLLGSCSSSASFEPNLPDSYCQCALRTMEANLPASQVGSPVTGGLTMVRDPDILRACR